MRNSRVHPAAEREFNRDIDWYNEQERGVGTTFARAVKKTVSAIIRDPKAGSPGEFGTRSLRVKRFPFTVVFGVFSGVIWIVAVAHMARRPGYWQHRIADLEDESE
jgi:hypothetical protein